MHGQMGADNTMPILDGTTGSHCPVPQEQQAARGYPPGGMQPGQQVLGLLSQKRPTLPGPSNEPHCRCSQQCDGLSASRFPVPLQSAAALAGPAAPAWRPVAPLSAPESEPTAPPPPTRPAASPLRHGVPGSPRDGGSSPG